MFLTPLAMSGGRARCAVNAAETCAQHWDVAAFDFKQHVAPAAGREREREKENCVSLILKFAKKIFLPRCTFLRASNRAHVHVRLRERASPCVTL